MQSNPTVNRLLTTASILGMLALSGITGAAEPQMPQISLTLKKGSVLEVVVEHSIPDPQYGWVLSHDGQFLSAERTAVYRTRLIDAGTYLLNAEVSAKDGQERMRSSMRITVPAVEKPPSAGTQGTEDALVSTVPPLDEKGRLITSPAKSIIEFAPIGDSSAPITFDLSDQRDSNRDGDALNDNDVAGTFFSQKGTPLLVWFTDVSLKRTLTIRKGVKTQTIHMMDKRTAEQEDELERKRVTIVGEQTGSGRVAFSLEFPRGVPTYPLLLTWDFGDGGMSLLDRPAHMYGRNGTFTVTVEVRNLTNGEVTEEASSPITITDAEIAPLTDGTEEGEEGGSLIGLMIKMLLGLLGVLLLGIVIAIAIAFVKKASAPKELGAEEKALPPEEEQGTKTLPPMEIEAEEVEEVEESKEERETTAVPPLNTSAIQKKEQPTKPPPGPPVSEPKPQEPEQPPKKDRGPLPPWLQPSHETVPPPSPATPTTPPPPPPPPTPSKKPTSLKPPPRQPPEPKAKEATPDRLQPHGTPKPPAQPPPKEPQPKLQGSPTPQPPSTPLTGTKEAKGPRPEPRPGLNAEALSAAEKVEAEGPVPEWLKNAQEQSPRTAAPLSTPESHGDTTVPSKAEESEKPIAFLKAEGIEELPTKEEPQKEEPPKAA